MENMENNDIKFLTKKEEAEFLANWNIEVLKFFDIIEKDEHLLDWINDLLEAVKEEDVTGLRMEYFDFIEQAQDLDPNQYKKLDEILRKKFGHGLFEADQKHIKRVTKIVEKGKISNEEQYYLLREYFERIWDMPEYKETAKKIEDIMSTFENKKKK